MEISKEDRELIRKFEGIMKRGHYVQSTELTVAYNRILDKHVSNTTCGSCLRQRTQELITALNRLEDKERKEAEEIKAQEASEQEEVDNTPQEEKEADTEEIKEEETKEENNDGDNTKSHKAKGRKKKQESAE